MLTNCGTCSPQNRVVEPHVIGVSKMGFPLHLFVEGIDDSFLCWICKQVLDNPLAIPCGHVFCSACVKPWIIKNNSCPCDCSGHITASDLNQVQPLNALIGKLTTRCWNHENGCQLIGQLRDTRLHLTVCPYDSQVAQSAYVEGRFKATTEHSVFVGNINVMEELRERARELQEEVFSLKVKLREQEDVRNIESIMDSGGVSITVHDKGYDITKVNGEDLSTATHEAAAEAFKRAAEPITVVLRRNNANGINTSNVGPCRSQSGTTNNCNNKKDRFSASTQTAQENSGMCFCQFLIENCRKMPDRLSSLVMDELVRYKLTATNPHLCSDVNDNFTSARDPAADALYLAEEDDDVFGVYYEEVTLKRPSSQDKLGIMLCDDIDQLSGATKVVVNEVASDSIAARSQNIFEGDQIVKVNGIPVRSMNEASRLLHKDNAVITFLICRQHVEDNEGWGEEGNEQNEFCRGDEGRILHDVTNFDREETATTTSEESRPRYLEHRLPEDCVEYAAIVSQKLSCEAMGTTDSGTSHSFTTACSQNEKDSGFGQTTDGTVQSTASKSTSDNRRFGTGSSGASSSHSAAREFTYVPVQKYHQKKRPVQHKVPAPDSGDSAKGSMERSIPEERESDLQRLNQAIENLEVSENNVAQTPNHPFDDEECDNVSPWVKIARQDYQEKIRQYENTGDARVIHPALSADADPSGLLANARSDSVATDNTSSAYSTGDSFRSSSSASGQRLSSESQTPPLSPEKQVYDKSPPYRNDLPPYGAKNHGLTMSYYVSSDGNSDGEGPACYLTHDDESGSEGFADAGLEFSPMFTPAINQHPKLQHSKSAPIPSSGHPVFANNFMSASVTASTKQLCNAAAQAAQTRRHTASGGENQSDCTDNSKSSSRSKSKSQRVTITTDVVTGQQIVVPVNDNCQQDGGAHPKPYPRHKLRRSSEQIKQPFVRPCVPNRSFSYTEGQMVCEQSAQMGESMTGSNGDVSSEWKVRVRNDGTRYITKRPVRERVLKEREQRLLAERCGITTDDDAVTELKLGRHWSREERKRHMRIAREKRRRKDFMQRCRLEALNENAPADGEIVELSHKKMTRRKHKRMLLDNFVTVQEILAHGDRSTSGNKVNPLLSVTYI